MESSTKSNVTAALDQKRLLRIIRIQGALNILLIAILVGCWIWNRPAQRIPTIEGIISGLQPELQINMPVIIYGDHRQLKTTDLVNDPRITVYGQLKNAETFRDRLPNFSITIQETTVIPKWETGEFAQQLMLKPGPNTVYIAVKWNGKERYRYQYQISYIQAESEIVPNATSTVDSTVSP